MFPDETFNKKTTSSNRSFLPSPVHSCKCSFFYKIISKTRIKLRSSLSLKSFVILDFCKNLKLLRTAVFFRYSKTCPILLTELMLHKEFSFSNEHTLCTENKHLMEYKLLQSFGSKGFSLKVFIHNSVHRDSFSHTSVCYEYINPVQA